MSTTQAVKQREVFNGMLRENEYRSGQSSFSEGPIFEAGPGWGEKIKKWLWANLYKKVIPAVVLLLIMLGFYLNNKNSGSSAKNNTPGNQEQEIIKQEIVTGDSKALLARKAIEVYLKTYNSSTLITKGQKIFAEEILRKKITPQVLKVGQIIVFSRKDVAFAVDQSLQLSQFQLEKWEEYARGARF